MTMCRARSSVALIALLALVAPLAGALAADGSGAARHCAMCAKQCCCAPRADRGVCRIERPCGREESTDPAGPTALGKPAVLSEIAALVPPESPGPLLRTPAPKPLDATPPPPERPPRSIL